MRKLAIMRALVRPELWLGCDRRAVIGVGAVAFSLIGPIGIAGGQYRYIVYGGIILLTGLAYFRRQAKRDPQHIAVYNEAVQYRHLYVGRSRWDAEGRGR